jgi:hypothetical protein
VGQLSISYRDVTAVAPAVTHFPEWVVALENIGFVRLGRVQGDVVPGGIEELMDDYEPQARDEAIAAHQVPVVVLAAPDGSAFADVDWFWGGPSVRFRTLTTDGRLVATHRAWEHMPAWPRPLRRVQRYRSLAQEQRLSASRGRSLEVVAGADAATMGDRHRAHLARLSARPEPHDSVAGYIRLAERAFEHEQRISDRARPATVAAMLLLVGGFVTALVLLWSNRSPAALAVVVLGALLVLWAQLPLAVWVRYARWVRPRFR